MLPLKNKIIPAITGWNVVYPVIGKNQKEFTQLQYCPVVAWLIRYSVSEQGEIKAESRPICVDILLEDWILKTPDDDMFSPCSGLTFDDYDDPTMRVGNILKYFNDRYKARRKNARSGK